MISNSVLLLLSGGIKLIARWLSQSCCRTMELNVQSSPCMLKPRRHSGIPERNAFISTRPSTSERRTFPAPCRLVTASLAQSSPVRCGGNNVSTSHDDTRYDVTASKAAMSCTTTGTKLGSKQLKREWYHDDQPLTCWLSTTVYSSPSWFGRLQYCQQDASPS
jgi:hypothetical protein